MSDDSRFYSYNRIMDIPAVYRMVIGQRSNGKTFGWCRMALQHYFDDGLHSAYIRRFDTMIAASNLETLFEPHLRYIEKKSEGKWNGTTYRAGAFYLCKYGEDKAGNPVKIAQDRTPFCRAYAINTWETSKGPDRGKVWSICFDEFITKKFYLANEFRDFQQLLSTIMRGRPCEIFMLANTVAKDCLYFRQMGIKHIRELAKGELDVYRLGQTSKLIAVEYSDNPGASEEVSEFFAFDNPELRMITSGDWEISLHRQAPPQMSKRGRILKNFFIEFDGLILHGEVRTYDSYPIIFIHPKTTEIKDRAKQIIFVEDQADGNPLHQVSIKVTPTRAHELIRSLIIQKKTFFSDNECGENFCAWAQATQGVSREAI